MIVGAPGGEEEEEESPSPSSFLFRSSVYSEPYQQVG